ncbi:MAG TPA: DinB family protein [Ktedonobacteraceae bacterium]|nr:DinB family protein [Ktedonobacteraceae bacterium]
MAELSLASIYKGWEGYQHHLVTVIAPLSPEQLNERDAPVQRSRGEQIAHIVAVRARWLSLDLREGGSLLDSFMGWDGWSPQPGGETPSTRSAAELVRGLEATWQVLQEALDRWTVADLEENFPPTYPGEEGFTRQYVLWHLIEHDLHHGGELSFNLGMHGLKGIDI